MNCTHCGATNQLRTATCWRCGKPSVVSSKEGEGWHALVFNASLVEEVPQQPDSPGEAVAFDFVESEEIEETDQVELAQAYEGRKMQCMHCAAEVHAQAPYCWKCGKVATEGVEPLYDDGLAPSEVIFVANFYFMRDTGEPFTLHMSPKLLDDAVIGMMFSAALIACERAGVFFLDLNRNPHDHDVQVTKGEKTPVWHWQTLESRLAMMFPTDRSRKLQSLVGELSGSGRKPEKVLFQLVIEALLSRGLVTGVETPRKVLGREIPRKVLGKEIPRKILGIEVPLNETFYRLTEAGREHAAKHPPDIVIQMIDSADPVAGVIEAVVKSKLIEIRTPPTSD